MKKRLCPKRAAPAKKTREGRAAPAPRGRRSGGIRQEGVTHGPAVRRGPVPASAPPPDDAGDLAPVTLIRTAVYRRVPPHVRARVDAAILLRPEDCPTLNAIMRKLDLASHYGITLASLRTYARRLERFIRPVVTSQLIAGLLHCLPEHSREQLTTGGEVLLLSRVVQTLACDTSSALPVADLARLATLLSSFRPRAAPARATARRAARRGSEHEETPEHPGIRSPDPAALAESVRALYGIPWPPGGEDTARDVGRGSE